MKKLRLKALELGAAELLKREQLRNVIGGDGSGSGSGSPYTDGCKACEPYGSTGGTFGCYRVVVGGDCGCVQAGFACDKQRL